jgi:hypothetical protein
MISYKQNLGLKASDVTLTDSCLNPFSEVLCEYSKLPTTQQEYQDVQALLEMADQPGKKTTFVSIHSVSFLIRANQSLTNILSSQNGLL